MINAHFRVDWPAFTLDLDLNLPGRGVTAIFGPSGSGKTTLLRCIAGLERTQEGYLSFKGDIWQDAGIFMPVHKRPLGYVFQEASLFPHLSVMGNLRYGLARSKTEQKVSLDQAVELLGIGHLLERKPERLSGGERQREILPYLERLHDELEIPVLYVTHSPDEVARLADYLVAMEAGRVTAHGPLGETLTRIDLPIRLGEERSVVLEGIVAERDEIWNLTRVEFNGGSLWTRDRGMTLGRRVRLRVPSGGVSLCRKPQEETSILNSLAAIVEAIGDDDHPAHSLVRVTIGGSVLLARITKRSVAALELEPGQPVWVQVKSVAVME